ncbi:MAG TPA: Fe2+-dependent dioxygenase [Ramlibacter sp.]|nr:Fe2+-dependent dioxygenase [Ramlibacter sp.]
MVLTLPLLDSGELLEVRRLLAAADWQDGRASAGAQASQVKNNEQLPAQGEAARAARAILLGALERSPQFLAAALPRKLFPPHFNRYAAQTNFYGAHVDSAVRVTADGQRLRTDLSCTVFLSDPADYDGGELVVHEGDARRHIKLPAGHAVLYPGTHVHEVLPVTRGVRLASFFWVESLVRSNEQRRLLHEFDQALMSLRAAGESDATVALVGTYHNLLRMWAET